MFKNLCVFLLGVDQMCLCEFICGFGQFLHGFGQFLPFSFFSFTNVPYSCQKPELDVLFIHFNMSLLQITLPASPNVLADFPKNVICSSMLSWLFQIFEKEPVIYRRICNKFQGPITYLYWFYFSWGLLISVAILFLQIEKYFVSICESIIKPLMYILALYISLLPSPPSFSCSSSFPCSLSITILLAVPSPR